MRARELTSHALVESCLEQIHRHEETLHACVQLYEDEALAAADRCNSEGDRSLMETIIRIQL